MQLSAQTLAHRSMSLIVFHKTMSSSLIMTSSCISQRSSLPQQPPGKLQLHLGHAGGEIVCKGELHVSFYALFGTMVLTAY